MKNKVYDNANSKKPSFINIYIRFAAAFLSLIFSFSILCIGSIAKEDSKDIKTAPGGNVTNQKELIEALGGDEAAGIFGDKVLLKADILLLDTITIEYGSYIIDGGNCTIKRGFDGGCMIVVGKQENHYFEISSEIVPELSLGLNDSYSTDDAFIIDGGYDMSDTAGESSQLSTVIKVFGKLNIYSGTVIKNSAFYAIYNEGYTEANELKIENCKMPIYNSEYFSMTSCTISGGRSLKGGAIYNEGIFVASECTFENNIADNGGTIYNAAGSEDDDKAIFYSSENEFISSSASENGGCIYNEANFIDSGSKINKCSAKCGGYIYNTGSFEEAKIFAQNCTGKNGGFAYNKGSLTLGASGTVDSCNAEENGGGIYNDTEGQLFISGTMLSSNSAVYGGGVFNKGRIEYSSGTLTYNKADIGEAILNDGTLVMTGSPVSNENNDIFIVSDDSAKHAIQINSAITAPYTARLTPGVYEDGAYKKEYISGNVLIMGDYAKEKYLSFSVSESGSSFFDWHITEEGILQKSFAYNNILLYSAIAVSVVIISAIIFIVIKHKKRQKPKETLC